MIAFSQKNRHSASTDPVSLFPFRVLCDSGKVHLTVNAGVCHRFNTCHVFISEKDSLKNEFLYKSKIFEEHTYTFYPKHSNEIIYGLYLEPIHEREPGQYFFLNLTCPLDSIEQFPFAIRSKDNSIWFECKDQEQSNETWRTLPPGTYLIYYKNTPPRIFNKIK